MTRPIFQRFTASALLLALVCASSAQAQSISSGNRHVLALTKDGSVLAWGDNRDGQLGLGPIRSGATAITIPLPARIVSVRASARDVFALDTDGNLWSWGRNTYGQLGDGTRTDRSEPRIVLRNVVHFPDADQSEPLAVDSQGKVWSWGLMFSSDAPKVIVEYPVRIVKAFRQGYNVIAIDEDGGVWGQGQGGPCVFSEVARPNSTSLPVKIQGLPPIRDLQLGRPYVVFPMFNGIGTVTAVDTTGVSWTWGSLNNTLPICQPRKGLAIKPFAPGYALTQAGGVVNQYDINSDAPAPLQPRLLASLPPARDLSIGEIYGYALTAGGDLWQWQRASESQADDGSGSLLRKVASGVASMSTYSSTGGQSVLYSTTDGQLLALGSDFDLQLGLATDSSARSSPARVVGLSSITSIQATGDTALALTQDGKVYAWGWAPIWNPGIYTLEATRQPKPLPIPLPVRSIGMHGFTMLVIGSDGTTWHWGTPVGVNTLSDADFRPATKIALGNAEAKTSSISKDNALILDADGNIWGLGTFSTSSGLVKYTQPFQQPSLPPAQQVVALGTASLALDNSGTVWAWGTDPAGSLWDNTSTGQYTAPKRILVGQTATSIHGGDGHFCAVLADGSAQCHGSKLGGSAGKIFRLHAAIKEAALSKGSPSQQPGNVHFRLADGTVWAYGEGHKGQLGVGTYGSVLEPTPVNAPAGTADLDLDPDTPTAVAPAMRPPFRVQATYSGGLGQLTLSGAVFGGPTSATAPDGKYNVYVVAIASDGPDGPPTTWFQRDDKGQWSPVQWPMPAYAIKADLGSANLSVPLDIFRNFPAQGLQNSRVYVGYGIDAYEMLGAGRLREVLVMADD
ncbi:hypothetical protein [Acidovorax sp. Root217]|uniref:RCC1 domain-containing protein n=1 Tax=Acidovorax sp. Root217 TaxID=1736492 RepID=UPI00070FD358|nr:hypothetical protein [Acidovorax sp. Root217]KRC27905.1 hypothetical protein ASE31_13960 [Acidovorax sp. Root217]